MSKTFQSPWFTPLFGSPIHKICLEESQLEIDILSFFQISQRTHLILFKEINSVHLVRHKLFTEIQIQLNTGGHLVIPNLTYRTAFEVKCLVSMKLK